MSEVREGERSIADALAKALEVLLEEAECFNVNGVYFNEKCMGHKGPDLAYAALDAYRMSVYGVAA